MLVSAPQQDGALAPLLQRFSDCVFWLTGDFAVLLKAGMSVKQAIVYNLLSALMAYVGMVIGTAVGQYTDNVTSWIFAITAGMFLYVALVDMVSWPSCRGGVLSFPGRRSDGHHALCLRSSPI